MKCRSESDKKQRYWASGVQAYMMMEYVFLSVGLVSGHNSNIKVFSLKTIVGILFFSTYVCACDMPEFQ